MTREKAERYGLVKSRKPSENKMAAPSENKAADIIADISDLSSDELQELRKDKRKSVAAAAKKELQKREEG